MVLIDTLSTPLVDEAIRNNPALYPDFDKVKNLYVTELRTPEEARMPLLYTLTLDEVKKAQAVMPYQIVEGDNNSVRVAVRGHNYSLPEISALVLKEMKARLIAMQAALDRLQTERVAAGVVVAISWNGSQLASSLTNAGERLTS